MPRKKPASEPSKIEEILSPLSNPMRVTILKIIGQNEPITYSKILEQTGLESGSFYWHVSKMPQLIQQDEQKKYRLTAKGRAAYQLIVDQSALEPPHEEGPYQALFNILGKLLFNISPVRGIIEISLLLFLWGYLLSQARALQVLTITEIYEEPPIELSWMTPLISITLMLLLSWVTTIFLAVTGIIRIPVRRIKKKIRSMEANVWILFSFTPLIMPSFVISLQETTNIATLQLITAIASFIASILVILFHTAAIKYSFNISSTDSFIVTLTLGYVILALAYSAQTIIPY